MTLKRRTILLTLLVSLFVLQPVHHPESGSLTLALLGDIMLGRGVQAAHQSEGWECTLAALVPYLTPADLALANLESPLTNAPYALSGYDLRASPDSVEALLSSGLDVLSLANNHILDGGVAGLEDTRAVLKSHALSYLGPDPVSLSYKINGVKLAFLSFDDITAPINLPATVQAVKQAKSTGALVVVSIHWGTEYQTGPNQRQRIIAQTLADSGASLIWGHHPHVLQPLAWLNREGKSPVLIAYSLGNAVFDQITPPDSQRGTLLLLTLNSQGVQEVHALPFRIDPHRGQVSLADQVTSQAVLNRLGPIAAPIPFEEPDHLSIDNTSPSQDKCK